jgi:hypothetical protein
MQSMNAVLSGLPCTMAIASCLMYPRRLIGCDHTCGGCGGCWSAPGPQAYYFQLSARTAADACSRRQWSAAKWRMRRRCEWAGWWWRHGGNTHATSNTCSHLVVRPHYLRTAHTHTYAVLISFQEPIKVIFISVMASQACFARQVATSACHTSQYGHITYRVATTLSRNVHTRTYAIMLRTQGPVALIFGGFGLLFSLPTGVTVPRRNI